MKRSILFCSAFTWLALSLIASDVTLAWTPSVSSNVVGYRIYGWTTNQPTALTNAQMVQVGNVTNATLTGLAAGDYTFAATAVGTNGAESPLSNYAFWSIPAGPTYLLTVQSSTNLIQWSNTPVFFRLKITQ